MPGTLGPHAGGPGRGIGFWAQQAYYGILPTPDPSKIFRGVWPTLPPQYFYPQYHYQDYSWTFSPGPGRIPVPPDTTKIFRGVWRSLPDQPPTPLLQPSVFQSWNTLYGRPPPAPFSQDDWPLPQQPWRLEQTWTYSYNLSLIGQDAMLVGEQRYELAPGQLPPDQIQLRSWQWSYNLSLIGKDRLPVGEQVYPLAPSQVVPEQIQLHSWSWSYNLNLRGQDQLATGEQSWELPPRDPREVRAWAWQYNLNLISQDRMAVGEQSWERPTLPIVPSAPTWAWQYNPNLIGQDFLPFRQRDWPLPIAAQQPALSWADPLKIWLTAPTLNITISQYWERPQLPIPPAQSWSWSYILSLISQDHMLTGVQVYDLAPSQKVPEQIQLHAWQWWYNLNLIGRDRLPTGEQNYELTSAQKPYEQQQLHSWQWSYNLSLVGKDQLATGEQSTDLAPAQKPYRIDQTWTWFYNLNLIGQDRMVTGQQSTDLPSRDFARLFQTWINSVNAALVTAPPVLDILKPQRDWPVPRGVEPDWRRSWEWQYSKTLIGQDQLPFRQTDWPLTPAPAQAAAGWIDQTKILLTAAPTFIIRQSDWPVPQQPAQAVQTWINTVRLALITRPFAQTDWPNPTPLARDPTLSTIAASYNKNLIGQDRLPNNQKDWPLSPAHALNQIPLQIMVQGKWFNLVPPTPLTLPLTSARVFDRPQLRVDGAADLSNPAWRWPQITPPPVSLRPPLRTLMGTGV